MSDAAHAHDDGHHGPNHDYHLVDPSPWPLVCSVFALFLFVFLTNTLEGASILALKIPFTSIGPVFGSAEAPLPFLALTLLSLALLIASMFMWWFDVIRESHKGDHTPVVQVGLRYGMMFFIASEVMFFFAFFFAYFRYAVQPITGDASFAMFAWPPTPEAGFDPLALPLYNTVILLLSGTTVTWAHEALRENKRGEFMVGLGLTVALGVLFTAMQVVEYMEGYAAGFQLDKLISGEYPITYASVFYIATGFHGFHVLVGTLFLLVCWMRGFAGHYTPGKHFGFEAAAWYWHFVDVVWIFLYVAIYWGIFDRT